MSASRIAASRLAEGQRQPKNEGKLDPDLCVHDANGTRIFFDGRVHIDRASMRALPVEASWPVLDYDVAVVRVPDPTRPAGFRYVDRPPRVDRVLFELTDIPRDGGFNGPDVVTCCATKRTACAALPT